MPAAAEVTQLLERACSGDGVAVERLLPMLYDELRDLAQRQLSRERKNHTLQATALVHEAFLKLVVQDKQSYANRAQFVALAATAMRRVLVNHAVARKTDKRGGALARVTLDEVAEALEDRVADLEALDSALKKLEQLDPAKARLVELRFFAGLTMDDAAQSLGIPLRTAERQWRMARAWLQQALADPGDALDTPRRP